MTINPVVSIITVSYNSELTIADTMNSVLSQDYRPIEYIIIDGKSTDNTIDVIHSFIPIFQEKGIAVNIISELDKGIYDAMNKGILIASGEIIGILNSDDIYYDQETISLVISNMQKYNSQCLYGDLIYFKKNNVNDIKRVWISGTGRFEFGWNPPHPTTFLTKETYEEVGLYENSYKISADYDLLYRVTVLHRKRITYLPKYLVKMRLGGDSTRNLKSNLIGNREIYLSLKKNGQRFKIFIIIIRIIRKFGQFRKI